MSSCNGHEILILALFSFLILSTTAHDRSSRCTENFYVMAKTPQCKKLPTLGAEFGWNFPNDQSHTIDIVFGARLDFEVGWLAWGVNPLDRPKMVGTRALIAIKEPNGPFIINTYNITIDTFRGCSRLLPTKISEFQNMTFHYSSENQYHVIFATLLLNPSVYNISRLNHIWQIGYAAEGVEPKMHPVTLQNLDSSETIDLRSGRSRGVSNRRHCQRITHGILSIIGWGFFLPIGVISARYLRRFPVKFRHWYALHVSCQSMGYILGTIGWILGLWLGYASKYYSFHTHRILAIFIFTFTTLQMFALWMKPKGSDEYRKYWNVFHHFLGYSLIAIISANIFKGIAIIKRDEDDHNWNWAFIGLALSASIAISLEIFTWIKFIRIRKKTKPEKEPTTATTEGQENQATTSKG